MFQSKLLSGVSLLALIALTGFPVASEARTRLSPSISVSEGYDDNVFTDKNNTKSDFVTRFLPRLQVRNDGDFGHNVVTFGATGRIYRQYSELNSLDTQVSYDLERRINPRLTIFTDGELANLEERDEVREDGEALSGGRPDLQKFDFSGGLRYQIQPLLSMGLTGSTYSAKYGSGGTRGPITSNTVTDRRDSDGYNVGLSFTQRLSLRDTLSLSSSYGYTALDAPRDTFGNEADTDTTIINAQLGWSRIWGNLWSTSFSVGGRTLKNKFSGGTAKSTGLIGSASIVRATKHGAINLSYSRDSRASSGGSSSVDVDSFGLGWAHQLSEHVRIGLNTSYQHFKSATDVQNPDAVVQIGPTCFNFFFNPVICVLNDEVDTKSLRASFRMDWRVRRRLHTFFSLDYADQDSSGQRFAGSYNKLQTTIGIRYNYDFEF